MTGDDAKTANRLSIGELANVAEAAIALLLASLAIAVLPFRTLMRTIANPRAGTSPTDIEGAANDVHQAIRRAERRMPLRFVCLHKGLATHWMLRRRGIATRMHYGISPGETALKAHVWVDLGGKTIMGEDESLGFARVATFPSERQRETLTDG